VGKLFWKFFAFVWLSQLAGLVAVGSLFWLTDRRTEPAFHDVAAGPMVATQVEAATEILRYAGVAALQSWSEHVPEPRSSCERTAR
jgi:hypothetical protein